MSLRRIFLDASRKLQLLVPITVMTAGAVVLLAALVFFLVNQFDATAVERERRVVESGVVQQIEQLDLVVVPQVDWDKAVAMIDHHMDQAFADAEFGRQLFTFNGVTHSFFIDGDGRVTYAYVRGQHEKPASFDPFRPLVAQLIGPIRRAEAWRGRIARHAEGQGPITRPIQANGVVRIGDTVYLVMASLVQPDLGSIQPKGPRAPV